MWEHPEERKRVPRVASELLELEALFKSREMKPERRKTSLGNEGGRGDDACGWGERRQESRWFWF